jgi:APA family basic amino acid/polyamine antiporter
MQDIPPSRPALLRRLGTFDASLIVIGGIIGSGIFVNPSRVAAIVHTTPLVMLAWSFGGLVALIGAGLFAELAVRRPMDGGLYAYLRDAFHPFVAFCYGWALLLVSQSGGIAASAITFAFYIPKIFGIALSGQQATLVAVTIIVVFTVINCFGVRESTNTQNAFVVVKLAAILGVVATGAFAVIHAGPIHAAAADAPLNPLAALGLALVPVMFAYDGWQTTSFMSGEMHTPGRSLPRGFFFGVACVIALYLAVNVVCLGALGERGLAATNTPASDVVQAAFGSIGAKAMAVIVAISTLGFIANQVLVSPRLYFQMAAEGTFFKQLAIVNPRTHVPIIAIAVQGATAILLAAFGWYDIILNWVTSVDFIFFALAAWALFRFRARDRRDGAAEPQFRIPLHPLSTGLFLAVCVGMIGNMVASDTRNTLLGLAVLASGVPVWYAFSRMTASKL